MKDRLLLIFVLIFNIFLIILSTLNLYRSGTKECAFFSRAEGGWNQAFILISAIILLMLSSIYVYILINNIRGIENTILNRPGKLNKFVMISFLLFFALTITIPGIRLHEKQIKDGSSSVRPYNILSLLIITIFSLYIIINNIFKNGSKLETKPTETVENN